MTCLLYIIPYLIVIIVSNVPYLCSFSLFCVGQRRNEAALQDTRSQQSKIKQYLYFWTFFWLIKKRDTCCFWPLWLKSRFLSYFFCLSLLGVTMKGSECSVNQTMFFNILDFLGKLEKAI